jgi:hypothetical protein
MKKGLEQIENLNVAYFQRQISLRAKALLDASRPFGTCEH